jgi:hypothetical protein
MSWVETEADLILKDWPLDVQPLLRTGVKEYVMSGIRAGLARAEANAASRRDRVDVEAEARRLADEKCGELIEGYPRVLAERAMAIGIRAGSALVDDEGPGADSPDFATPEEAEASYTRIGHALDAAKRGVDVAALTAERDRLKSELEHEKAECRRLDAALADALISFKYAEAQRDASRSKVEQMRAALKSAAGDVRHGSKCTWGRCSPGCAADKVAAALQPAPVQAAGFDAALEAASDALSVLGTGRLRETLVKEGARSYAVSAAPVQAAEPKETP